jgi:hypothetical protein
MGSSTLPKPGRAEQHLRRRTAPAPTPGNFLADPGEGSIVRVEPSGAITPIVSGLDYPASITFGSDGDLYVTNNDFSLISNENGTILRIRIQG